MVYAVSERPAVGLSGPMADPEVLSSEDTAKSRLALYTTIIRRVAHHRRPVVSMATYVG